jgi:hypothetical protein
MHSSKFGVGSVKVYLYSNNLMVYNDFGSVGKSSSGIQQEC